MNTELNRIILIGNGFDRSLGIPTSYSHFLDWIINTTLDNLLKNVPNRGRGNLISFSVENEFYKIDTNIVTCDAIESLNLNTKGYKKLLEEIARLRHQRDFKLSLSPKFSFIDKLFSSYNKNSWVDVEELYFQELLISKTENIKILNDCLNLIKTKLGEYLSGLKKIIDFDTFNHYRRHFFGSILEYKSNYQSYEESGNLAQSYYFVNFNYTSFLKELLNYAPTDGIENTTFNHIHGEIIDDRIIFGYGNETGDDYLRLEKQGDDFLENIKSTHYFNSTHYRDLELQLSQPYEVYVYGLSCGLSDNILLKTIMEKSNCKQIRIFYKQSKNGKDNFRNILMNISRTLKDKEDMRSKIISKQTNDSIPQLV